MAEALRKPAPMRDEAPENPRTLPRSPAAPADKGTQKESGGSEEVRRSRRRNRIRWGLFGLLPLVLIIGAYWYITGGQIMSTDDAYVEADKVGVSTDVAGIVKDVNVKENEQVQAGQVLYRLDPRHFQIALDNAKANLAQTALGIEAMKQDYARMVSDIAAQQAQVDLDQTNFNRATMLLRSGTATQAAFDQAQATLQTDKSKLEAVREQAQVQLARLGGKTDIDVTATPAISAGPGAGRRGAAPA